MNNFLKSNRLTIIFSALIMLCLIVGWQNRTKEMPEEITQVNNLMIKGWNILSPGYDSGMKAINKSSEYGINHLQLSHRLIMDLHQVRNASHLGVTRKLLKAAHEKGIPKVYVWDHALYDLNYYPDRFKTKEGLINLDDSEFWSWFKADYRSMLDSIPDIKGIVLTFIETGAKIEDQHSDKWKTAAEKLAHLVDTVAIVVIDERKMELFARTFIYTNDELDAMLSAVNQIQHPEVRIMSKEVPHDFFLYHPVNRFAGRFDRPTLIEFDLGHEYNGQSVIASILPEVTVERWKYFAGLPHVIGYVARTDRYRTSQSVGTPTEINLYALKRLSEDTTLTASVIVKEYITERYGAAAIPNLSKVFLQTDDIVMSMFYTLGLHDNSRSSMDFEKQSNYSRNGSGKWLEDYNVKIAHGVNRKFHYYKDIIQHLSPARYKARYLPDGQLSHIGDETPFIIDNGWVSAQETMNPEYLEYVITEKNYAVKKSEELLDLVRSSEKLVNCSKEDYNELLQLYEKTNLTAKIYLAAAKAYFGYRTYLNHKENKMVNRTITEGLTNIKRVAKQIRDYPHKGPRGTFIWERDADIA